MRILIAEDDIQTRRSLEDTLRELGHEIVATGNGREALEQFKNSSFQMLITERILPELDGITLIKEIRSMRQSEHVHIIMLSAPSNKDDLVQGLKAGADDFLAKPVNANELQVRLLAGECILELKRKLHHQKADLEAANMRMKKDLEAAAAIQMSLLPKEAPNVESIEVDWYYSPSEELAGDIYNTFLLDESHLGIYLLDVSGHGVPAALLAVSLSRMLSPIFGEASILKKRLPVAPYYQLTQPADVARILNERFQMDPDNGQYFTLIYGILNFKSLEFKYVSAGHPELIRLGSDGVADLVGNGDVPIGFLEEYEYEEHTLQLQPGDRIYLYSDGIPEAENVGNEQFETHRMLETLSEQSDLKDSITHLVDTVQKWCEPGSFNDDVSILALKIKP